MKAGRKYLLWFVVVMMFCALSFGGCGGSSSDDSSTESTDESTGRNQGGWEDLAFDEFAGAWEIASITAGMGNNITFDPPTLGVARCKFTTDSENNTITLATLDGRVWEYLRCNLSDSQGHTLNQAVILSGGTYSSTNLSNVYRQDINDAQGSYRYLLQGLDANRGTSFPYKYLYFYNTYTAQDNPDNSYVIQTVLQKIPDDTVEDVSLAAGSWNIVSASLQVRGVSEKYIFSDATYDYKFNPNLKLIPVSSTRLNWTQNLEQEDPYLGHRFPLTLEFLGATRGLISQE